MQIHEDMFNNCKTPMSLYNKIKSIPYHSKDSEACVMVFAYQQAVRIRKSYKLNGIDLPEVPIPRNNSVNRLVSQQN